MCVKLLLLLLLGIFSAGFSKEEDSQRRCRDSEIYCDGTGISEV